MSVWVVAFDESEQGTDPLLRVFPTAQTAKRAIDRMCKGTPFSLEVADELDELDEFTLTYYDPEEGDRLLVCLRQCRIEEPTEVTNPEVL